MDINALRVFNALHSLSISEEEFALIESEQGHTERSGLYIGCIKKIIYIYMNSSQLNSTI